MENGMHRIRKHFPRMEWKIRPTFSEFSTRALCENMWKTVWHDWNEIWSINSWWKRVPRQRWRKRERTASQPETRTEIIKTCSIIFVQIFYRNFVRKIIKQSLMQSKPNLIDWFIAKTSPASKASETITRCIQRTETRLLLLLPLLDAIKQKPFFSRFPICKSFFPLFFYKNFVWNSVANIPTRFKSQLGSEWVVKTRFATRKARAIFQLLHFMVNCATVPNCGKNQTMPLAWSMERIERIEWSSFRRPTRLDLIDLIQHLHLIAIKHYWA